MEQKRKTTKVGLGLRLLALELSVRCGKTDSSSTVVLSSPQTESVK